MSSSNCIKNLPRWVLIRYNYLTEYFGDKPFTVKDMESLFSKLLSEKKLEHIGAIKEFLSILKKEGCIKVIQNALDEKYVKYQIVESEISKLSLIHI